MCKIERREIIYVETEFGKMAVAPEDHRLQQVEAAEENTIDVSTGTIQSGGNTIGLSRSLEVEHGFYRKDRDWNTDFNCWKRRLRGRQWQRHELAR